MNVLRFSTRKKYEFVDITEDVKNVVKGKSGLCVVYVPHATAGIVINENADPNIGLDLLDALDELIKEGKWRHDRIDDNGAAHIKASILGPSEVILVEDGELKLGRWQGLMLVDLDGPKERKVFVNVI